MVNRFSRVSRVRVRFNLVQGLMLLGSFRPSYQVLWNTLPADICQLSPDSFKIHLNSFSFIWAPDYVLFYRLHCTVFYPKLQFTVCCTAFSVYICLFARGAVLLEIESVPVSEDEDADELFQGLTVFRRTKFPSLTCPFSVAMLQVRTPRRRDAVSFQCSQQSTQHGKWLPGSVQRSDNSQSISSRCQRWYYLFCQIIKAIDSQSHDTDNFVYIASLYRVRLFHS